MENQDNLIGVLSTLYNWRKRIKTIVIVAFLGSIVISLLMPNYYKAKTSFYAASMDLNIPDKVFGHSKSVTHYYGDDEERNRIMTIGYSEALIQMMVDTFDLYNIYDIDPEGEKSQFKVHKKFLKMYNIQETKHGSLELTVEAKDKELAKRMANTAMDKINSMGQELNKRSQINMISILNHNIAEHERNLKVIGDSLLNLRKKYGIYNIESQSELIASLVAKDESKLAKKEAELEYLQKHKTHGLRDSIVKISSTIKGLKSSLFNLTSPNSNSNFNLKRFNDGIAVVEVLANLHSTSRNAYSSEKKLLEEFKSVNQSDTPAIHVLAFAKTPNIKSRPIRSIIVLAATFAAFIFSCLGILLFESYRKFNWDAIKNA